MTAEGVKLLEYLAVIVLDCTLLAAEASMVEIGGSVIVEAIVAGDASIRVEASVRICGLFILDVPVVVGCSLLLEGPVAVCAMISLEAGVEDLEVGGAAVAVVGFVVSGLLIGIIVMVGDSVSVRIN